MEVEHNNADATERARRIKLVLFDVDGVLTDGTIWVVPVGGHAEKREAGPSTPLRSAQDDNSGVGASAAPQDDNANVRDGGFGLQSQTMAEMKGFSAHDGIGISLARIAGLRVGFVTKRVSEAVKVRARDLKIEFVYMGQAYKMQAVREILAQTGLAIEQVAFVGDDIVDISVMRQCGLAIAVANARSQALAVAHWTTPNSGGHGAGRDAIEFILSAQGVLDATVARYLDDKDGEAAAQDIGAGRM